MSEMLERRVLRDCYSMIYYQWRWSLTKKTDELSLSHKKFQCAFKSGGHDQRPSPPSTKNFVIRLLGSACVTGLALNTEMNDVSVADYSPSGGIYLVGCKDASITMIVKNGSPSLRTVYDVAVTSKGKLVF